MSDPVRIGTRGTLIMAGYPDITGAIPTVIAADPHEPRARGWSRTFHDGGWWADAYDHLR